MQGWWFLMRVLDVLLTSDPVIMRLTKIYLLDKTPKYSDDGYIERYLSRFNHDQKMWGQGVYGPKWISTHYTMMELRYMEINPKHKIYQEALLTLLTHEWKNQGMYNLKTHQDLCVVGMLLNLACYGYSQSEKIHEMIDHILAHTMTDGGWNCAWERKPMPKISSVHTTLSILEGLATYQKHGYTYRINEVKEAMLRGIEVLLSRDLIYIKHTKTPIHPMMAKASYPPRWKYDYLRALEFLSDIHYPDDLRMNDALNLLISQLKGPFMVKGSQISGLIHFPLEESKYGMFNTLRALKILRTYRNPTYQKLINI